MKPHRIQPQSAYLRSVDHPTIETVQRAVSEFYQVPMTAFSRRRGPWRESWARMVAISIFADKSGLSNPEAARHVCHHYATIRNAKLVVANIRSVYPAVDREIEEIVKRLSPDPVNKGVRV